MRTLWIAGGLLLAVCVVACGDDLIPEYEEPAAQPQQQPIEQQPIAKQGASGTQEAETESDAVADLSPRWEGGRLIVVLKRAAPVYPLPGLSWQALEEAAAGTQLSIDAQTEYGEEVWLRLLLYRGDTAWLRLRDSGVSRREAESLPETLWSFPLARLRWDQIALDLGVDPPGHAFWVDNRANSHSLVGRSEDSTQVAVRLLYVNSYGSVMWVNTHAAEFEEPIDSLPIYIGECCVRKLPKQMAIAEIVSHSAPVSLRPHGKFDALELKGGDGRQYPIIGRSADAEWIALRVELLSQGYVWAPIHFLVLNVEVDEIPIFIGTATEVLSVGAADIGTVSYSVTEGFRRWRWLPDGRFIGVNDDGVWQWKPEIGELREAVDVSAPVVSPDGSYSADRQCPDQADTTDCWRDVVITSAEDGGRLVFPNVAFDGRYYPDQDRLRPWLTWSPNSRYLLNVAPAVVVAPPERLEVLGVDGSRNSLPEQDWARWLADSTLLTRNELGYHLYRADGLLLRTIDFEIGEWLWPSISSSEPLTVAAGRVAGSDEPPGFHLIDLSSGEVTRLPPPLDQRSRVLDGRLVWRPLVFSGDSLYFYLDTSAFGEPNEAGRMLRYDLRAAVLSPVDGVHSPSGGSNVRSLCFDDCRVFAVSFTATGPDFGPTYIIESEALADGRPKVTEVQDSPQSSDREFQTWSPNGALLLLTKELRTLPYDERGFAIPQVRANRNARTTWGFAEYQIVDAADGRIQQRFRALPRECGGFHHRGEWSPDGRWIVFAPQVWHCK